MERDLLVSALFRFPSQTNARSRSTPAWMKPVIEAGMASDTTNLQRQFV
jgi:hypothetical protein